MKQHDLKLQKLQIYRFINNFFSFTPSIYKIGLIKTLLDRSYKINNTWRSFENDLENLTKI